MQIAYSQGQLSLSGEKAGTRDLTPADLEKLKNWSDRYDALVRTDATTGGFVTLGQELLAWLDGSGHWLSEILQGSGRRVLEFAIEDAHDPDGRHFLDPPWELLADKQGFLALDEVRPLVLSRRIGAAGKPVEPAHADLLLMFMAASPEGVQELDFEREEAGILNSTARLPLHLRVEESGCLEVLSDRLAEEAPVEALHLSCHGNIENDEPILALENPFGQRDRVTVGRLVEKLGEQPPPLIFVSACRSAQQPLAAPSLSLRLVRAGLPNVIGWDGSVYDTDASHFAKVFYEKLAARSSVAYAAAMARAILLQMQQMGPPEHQIGQHWHLARVYLGPTGGGPVCANGKPRRDLTKDAGYQAFLDKSQQVPVASAREFVGRRRAVQAILRAFDEPNYAGVLIHGMGRLGKSSLAARVANRLPRHRSVVVFRDYRPQEIWSRILDGLPPQARRDLQAAASTESEAEFEAALRAALEGPCALHDPANRRQPILLIIDDLERILDTPQPQQPLTTVQAQHQAMLRAVIGAFAASNTESRLLLTSRHRFTLPDRGGNDLSSRLFDRPLAAMTEREREKQVLAVADAAAAAMVPSGPRTEGEKPSDKQGLLQQCVALAQGSPGLQALLTRTALRDPALASKELDAVSRFYSEGIAPSEGEIATFFRDLKLETYVAALTPDEQDMARAALLFEDPAPRAAVAAAGEVALGHDPKPAIDRLAGLGLFDTLIDALDGPKLLSLNALVRPLFKPFDDEQLLAQAAARPLAEAWRSGEIPHLAGAADTLRLALMAGDVPDIHAETAVVVGDALLGQNRWADALAVVRPALEAQDAARTALNVDLVRIAVECARRLGEREILDRWLIRARALKGQDTRSFAMLRGAIADVLQERGELDEALRILREEAVPAFRRLDDVRSLAVTQGKIADVLFRRSELDESLSIRREEEVPVYQRLGDLRSLAVTQGKIADVLFRRGELDEALRIRREEQLPVYQRLRDERSVAVTQGKIADVLFVRGEWDKTLRIRREEQLPVYQRLKDVRWLAVTQGQIADVLFARGELDEALRIRREEQLPVYKRLREVRELAVTQGKIADVLFVRGELDEALRIRREEQLPVYKCLREVRELAVTQGKIADVLFVRGELDEALRIRREEQLPVYKRLRDVRELAVTQGQIADVLFVRGELDEALRIRREEQLPVYTRLGDVRSVAVTQRKIADVLFAHGELDEALRILREDAVPASRRLGDVRSLAMALFTAAQIELRQGNADQAVPKLTEAYSIVDRVGEVTGIAAVGEAFGEILARAGNRDQGLTVLRRSAAAYRKLGQLAQAENAETMIQTLGEG